MSGNLGFIRSSTRRAEPVSDTNPLPVGLTTDVQAALVEPPAGADYTLDIQKTIGGQGKAVLCPAGATTTLATNGTGSVGNVLNRLTYMVTDEATATVEVMDGDGTVYVDGVANPFNNLMVRRANSNLQFTDFDGQPSFNGPFKVKCGAGVVTLAQGFFADGIE